MKSKSVRNMFILLAVAFMSLAQVQTAHAARHALLIGNDSYQDVPALRNARADAQAMASALEKAGYTVTVMQDRNLKEMKDDVRNFKAQIKGGDEVIFFYSGHGVQIEAMNYLLPVDVRAESEDQVRDDALALSHVLEDIREQKPALTMAVIDACRDNPFKGTGRSIGGRGLTGVGGANGQMVIYSAGEGQQALDRLSDGDPVKNGLFTRVFIKEMTQPGVPIDQVARKVRAEVNRMAKTVDHEQVPAIYDQVIGDYYFYAQNDTGVDDVEILFWQSVKDSSDPAELQAYLEKYPDGQFSVLANARIKRIEQSNVVPTSVPAVVGAGAPADAPAGAPANLPADTPTVAEEISPAVESAAAPIADSPQPPAIPEAPEPAAAAEQTAPADAAPAITPAAASPQNTAPTNTAQATAVKATVTTEVAGTQPLAGPTVEAATTAEVLPLAGPTVEAAAEVTDVTRSAAPETTAPTVEQAPK